MSDNAKGAHKPSRKAKRRGGKDKNSSSSRAEAELDDETTVEATSAVDVRDSVSTSSPLGPEAPSEDVVPDISVQPPKDDEQTTDAGMPTTGGASPDSNMEEATFPDGWRSWYLSDGRGRQSDVFLLRDEASGGNNLGVPVSATSPNDDSGVDTALESDNFKLTYVKDGGDTAPVETAHQPAFSPLIPGPSETRSEKIVVPGSPSKTTEECRDATSPLKRQESHDTEEDGLFYVAV